MAIKRYFADADNTITNAFRPSLTSRGTDANMGASDVLEVFSVYGQASSGSTELERILIKFPISEITGDRSTGDLPIAGSVSFYLKMSNARHSQTVPRQFTMNISAVSRSWEEGFGLDMDGYTDIVYPSNEGSTWMSASQTTAWTRMGGDYHDSPIYTNYFDKGIEDLEVDVTPLIEEWVAGTKDNYGFGVHLTGTQEAYYGGFRSTISNEALMFNQSDLSILTQSNGAANLPAWNSIMGGTEANAKPYTISVWLSGTRVTPALDGSQQSIMVAGDPTSAKARRNINLITEATVNGAGTPIATPDAFVFQHFVGRSSAAWNFTTTSFSGSGWNHWAFTQGSGVPTGSNIPTLYLNGISQSLSYWAPGASPPGNNVADFLSAPSFGGRNFLLPSTNPALYYQGAMDELAIYSASLSDTDILKIYNSGTPSCLTTPSFPEDLSVWYRMGDKNDFITDATTGAIYNEAGIFPELSASAMNFSASSIIASSKDFFECLTDNPNSGELMNLVGSQYSFYTKKFFGRGSEFYYKRPYIEARWNSSVGDDRGNFYASSSLLSAEDNLHTIYLYNVFGGRLKNIPGVGTGEIYVKAFDAASAGTDLTPTAVTGGFVSTGVYSASFALETALTTVYDRWYDSGLTTCYHTGTISVKSHAASAYNPNPKYVVNITNLKPSYTKDEQVRLRLYSRQKDWSPTIYTVANSNIETSIIESASYQIFRIVDDLSIVPYGTSSDNYTQMSYDVSGNYFDFDMGILQSGYSYGIKVAFYDETSYVEQPYLWKFRVESLNEY